MRKKPELKITLTIVKFRIKSFLSTAHLEVRLLIIRTITILAELSEYLDEMLTTLVRSDLYEKRHV